MSQTEADTFENDQGLKPYQVSGKPLQAKEWIAGVSEKPSVEEVIEKKEEVPDDKASQEAEKAVKTREAKIQEASEEYYGLRMRQAIEDPKRLDSLIAGDAIDRRIASKILQRNTEHFGASTFEEWELKRAKDRAGEDPTAQAMAEMRVKQTQLEREQKESKWDTWKKENAVSAEASEIADQIHKDNPTMSYGLVIAAARGMKQKPDISAKASASTAHGSVGAPQKQEVDMNSPIARQLLRNVDMKRVERAAKKYL